MAQAEEAGVGQASLSESSPARRQAASLTRNDWEVSALGPETQG